MKYDKCCNEINVLFYFIAGLVSCAINAKIYIIAAFILFYFTAHETTSLFIISTS